MLYELTDEQAQMAVDLLNGAADALSYFNVVPTEKFKALIKALESPVDHRWERPKPKPFGTP